MDRMDRIMSCIYECRSVWRSSVFYSTMDCLYSLAVNEVHLSHPKLMSKRMFGALAGHRLGAAATP